MKASTGARIVPTLLHRVPVGTILPSRVRLGAFELDLRAGELRGREGKVMLQQQPFQVLAMLVERRGEVATREEIRKKLWPNDTVVRNLPAKQVCGVNRSGGKRPGLSGRVDL